MTFTELKKDLDPEFRRWTKAEFVEFLADESEYGDPKVRVGGPTGKGRITVKRALALLGV